METPSRQSASSRTIATLRGVVTTHWSRALLAIFLGTTGCRTGPDNCTVADLERFAHVTDPDGTLVTLVPEDSSDQLVFWGMLLNSCANDIEFPAVECCIVAVYHVDGLNGEGRWGEDPCCTDDEVFRVQAHDSIVQNTAWGQHFSPGDYQLEVSFSYLQSVPRTATTVFSVY